MAKILDKHYAKTERADQGDISFDPDSLRLFLAVDASKTVRDVAKEVKMSTEAFKVALIKLIKLKLIEPVEDKVELVDKSAIDAIRASLIQLMGPLGEVLLGEAEEELSLEESKIPVAVAEKFIDCIAGNIPGTKQRDEFRRSIQVVMPSK